MIHCFGSCRAYPEILTRSLDLLQVSDLYDPREQWASYVINAIKAKEFHTKDVNYIARQGEVSLF